MLQNKGDEKGGHPLLKPTELHRCGAKYLLLQISRCVHGRTL